MTEEIKTETPQAEPLMEVALVEEKSPSEPQENPFGFDLQNWNQWTQGVGLPVFGGAAVGAYFAGTVPVVVKWNTGWKEVAASLATTLVGGALLSKMNRAAGYGFVVGGGIVTLFKAIRLAMGGAGIKLLGGDVGDLIYGADDDLFGEEDLFGEDDLFGKDVFTEEQLFGIGEDPIIPTADADY